MKIEKENQIAWAAGIIEGEGSFILQGADAPTIQVGMTDKDIIAKLPIALGCGYTCSPYLPKDGRRKPIYFFKITKRNDALKVTADIWPYLGERRKDQATNVHVRYMNSPIKRRKVT